MLAHILFMFVCGISLSQAVSDPHQVTLRWLRLGGLIAVALLAVAALSLFVAGGPQIGDDDSYQAISRQSRWVVLELAVTGGLAIGQLMLVQLAHRQAQRLTALAAFAGTATIIWTLNLPHDTLEQIGLQEACTDPSITNLALTRSVANLVGAGLVGGCLMTMLIGHAYLAAGGQMSQAPFMRLVIMVAVLLTLRLILSALVDIRIYVSTQPSGFEGVWVQVMVLARYAVGLIVPALFITMTYDCVRRRANQSATGILYVTTVLVSIGEGTALALHGSM